MRISIIESVVSLTEFQDKLPVFRNSIKNVERAAENRQNALQNHSWAPKNDPKGAQEDQQIEPKPQDDKRAAPRRSQDRLSHPRGSISTGSPPPLGRHFGTENRTKTEPKTIQNRSEKQEAKKTIQDDLGSFWGAIFNEKTPKTVGKRNVS